MLLTDSDLKQKCLLQKQYFPFSSPKKRSLIISTPNERLAPLGLQNIWEMLVINCFPAPHENLKKLNSWMVFGSKVSCIEVFITKNKKPHLLSELYLRRSTVKHACSAPIPKTASDLCSQSTLLPCEADSFNFSSTTHLSHWSRAAPVVSLSSSRGRTSHFGNRPYSSSPCSSCVKT